MRPLREVQAEILQSVAVLPTVAVPVAAAHGRVLAADVVADELVPPFANTAMDGYAVRSADTSGASGATPVDLRVVGEVPAGVAPTVAVGPGEAIRIMTGAPMPDGADAVVMVERTERLDAEGQVRISLAVGPGEHVRPAGGDVVPGTVVFTPGTVLGAAHLGVLASLGRTSVDVVRQARVGVLSTGDEVVVSGALAPGQIRDSNRPMLLALLAEAGCEGVDLGVARDDEAEIAAAITRGVQDCDAVITSGAVSVGDYDFVKVAIERLAAARGGADSGYTWSQVAIRPAKPLAFGRVGGVPIFGLPGNPVSSHVSFELFARPALKAMMGHRSVYRPEVVATAAEAFARRPDGKLHLDRVRVAVGADGRYVVRRSGFQASNVLSGMANANGLALLPDGDGVPAGGSVRVWLLGEPEANASLPD